MIVQCCFVFKLCDIYYILKCLWYCTVKQQNREKFHISKNFLRILRKIIVPYGDRDWVSFHIKLFLKNSYEYSDCLWHFLVFSGARGLPPPLGLAKIFFQEGTLSKNIQKNFQNFFNFLKFSKKLLRKLFKMDFLAYFSKNLTNPAFNFCAFGRKALFAGNFWENFLKKIAKIALF